MNTDGKCVDGATCQEALVQLEAYLDGELPGEQLEEIREHLAACYPCTGRASFDEQLRAIVRRDCVEDAPASLLDRIQRVLADDIDTTTDRGQGSLHG
ncbi:MAG: mycothiol system anti-sigma-R factor [Nitriliruptoraceae bacterium]